MQKPIVGIGYYLNLGYQGHGWAAWLDYGEYYPQQLGDPNHDRTIRRGIVKTAFTLTSHLHIYSVVIAETGGFVAQDNRRRRGAVVLAGLQWSL